jgi:hypothetical protein
VDTGDLAIGAGATEVSSIRVAAAGFPAPVSMPLRPAH